MAAIHPQSTWGHVLYVASMMVVGWQSHRGTQLEVHLKSAPNRCVCSFTPTPEVSSLLSSLLLLLEWISMTVLSCLPPNKGKLCSDVMAGHSEPLWNCWDVVPEEVRTAASWASSQGLQGLHAVGCGCFIERVTRIHFPKRAVERFSQRGSHTCTYIHLIVGISFGFCWEIPEGCIPQYINLAAGISSHSSTRAFVWLATDFGLEGHGSSLNCCHKVASHHCLKLIGGSI